MSDKKAPKSFIVVLYDVPDKPSRIKVGVWRKLKRLGGLYHRFSVCILPNTPEIVELLKEILDEIRKYGIASALIANPLEEKDIEAFLTLFKLEREKEYNEILEECQEFIEEIEKNLETGNVTQEEAEELEEMLEALKKWFKKVSARDWSDSEAKRQVEEAIQKCENALIRFIEQVLVRQNNE